MKNITLFCTFLQQKKIEGLFNFVSEFWKFCSLSVIKCCCEITHRKCHTITYHNMSASKRRTKLSLIVTYHPVANFQCSKRSKIISKLPLLFLIINFVPSKLTKILIKNTLSSLCINFYYIQTNKDHVKIESRD